ncbi:MAG: hypothetical protein H6625_02660 [Bdellovibrionaceae bacterium]|nr:hypothetical protein [Pseudobdellovibrionaceae bacterium]
MDRGNELLRKVEAKFSPSNIDSLGQLYWSLKLMQTTNPDVDILQRETKTLLDNKKIDIQN